MILMSAIKGNSDAKNIVLRTNLQEQIEKINNAMSRASPREQARLKQEKKRIERAILNVR